MPLLPLRITNPDERAPFLELAELLRALSSLPNLASRPIALALDLKFLRHIAEDQLSADGQNSVLRFNNTLGTIISHAKADLRNLTLEQEPASTDDLSAASAAAAAAAQTEAALSLRQQRQLNMLHLENLDRLHDRVLTLMACACLGVTRDAFSLPVVDESEPGASGLSFDAYLARIFPNKPRGADGVLQLDQDEINCLGLVSDFVRALDHFGPSHRDEIAEFLVGPIFRSNQSYDAKESTLAVLFTSTRYGRFFSFHLVNVLTKRLTDQQVSHPDAGAGAGAASAAAARSRFPEGYQHPRLPSRTHRR